MNDVNSTEVLIKQRQSAAATGNFGGLVDDNFTTTGNFGQIEVSNETAEEPKKLTIVRESQSM